MAHRMIACDIDGTLLNNEAHFTDHTLATLRRCIGRGTAVALVTGRRLRSSIEVARMIDRDIPIVANDGAVVLAPDGTVIHSDTFDPDRALRIAEACLATGHSVFMHRFTFEGPDLYYKLHPGFAPSETYIKLIGADAEDLEEIPQSLSWRPLKISTMGAKDALEALQLKMGLEDSSTITFDMYANCYWLQAVPPGCDKGAGLKILARHLKIAPGDIVAFGDNYNDLPMFEVAGTAVAMSNAPDDIKARADVITSSNDKDGVARFLDDVVLCSPPQVP